MNSILHRTDRAPGVLGILARRWAAALLATVLPAQALAQEREAVPVRHEIFVGSDQEDYLRVLQVHGDVPRYPWSIRGFAAGEVDRLLPADSLHPWGQRYELVHRRRAGLEVAIVRPRAVAIYNSGFPYGSNDGAIWAGRGLTTAVQAGLAARLGPVSLTLAPLAFRAENRPFELAPSGEFGDSIFRDSRLPGNIDLPQRFGNDAYTHADPGQSTLRIDLPVLTVGISTAAQQWGPALEYPLLLGNNAGGFPHAFLGTSAPVDLWIGKLHGRVVWGQLDQSEFSPVEEGETRRFVSGVAGLITPRGLDGLEIGLARFFHTVWPEDGLGSTELYSPFEGLFKQPLYEGGNPDVLPQNQLAGAFARWVFPGSGLEVYGEFVREDHAWDLRHFLVEVDDLSGHSVGIAKTWGSEPTALTVLRLEVMNSETSRRGREATGGGSLVPLYHHGQVRQGHTHRGQLLVSTAAYGGAGAVLAVERYHSAGRWSIEWRREQRQSRVVDPHLEPAPAAVDVMHAIDAETLWFLGRFDVTTGITGVYNFNRNFGGDAFNPRIHLGLIAAL